MRPLRGGGGAWWCWWDVGVGRWGWVRWVRGGGTARWFRFRAQGNPAKKAGKYNRARRLAAGMGKRRRRASGPRGNKGARATTVRAGPDWQRPQASQAGSWRELQTAGRGLAADPPKCAGGQGGGRDGGRLLRRVLHCLHRRRALAAAERGPIGSGWEHGVRHGAGWGARHVQDACGPGQAATAPAPADGRLQTTPTRLLHAARPRSRHGCNRAHTLGGPRAKRTGWPWPERRSRARAGPACCAAPAWAAAARRRPPTCRAARRPRSQTALRRSPAGSGA